MAQDRSNCQDEKAAGWAARLSQGDLTAAEDAAYVAWLDENPSNAGRLDAVVAAWRLVETFAATAELMDLREEALAATRRARTRNSGRAPFLSVRLRLAAASIAAAGVAIAGCWGWLAPERYETAIGERRVVALSDGSKASLDGDSQVKVRYTEGRRQIWLTRGRAKFDVARDSLRPFTVTAAETTVIATGTSFSVERLDHELRVALYEGKISVIESPPALPRLVGEARRPVRIERMLTPGFELIEAKGEVNATKIVALDPDPQRSQSWETGQLTFDDEPLSLVVERINRHAPVPLRLGDNEVGKLRISGVVGVQDAGKFVRGLTDAFGVRVVVLPDAFELYSP